MAVQMQQPDGTWGPATPEPPSPGYDAEVSGHGPYRWALYHDCTTEVAKGLARTRFGAQLALVLAKHRHQRRG